MDDVRIELICPGCEEPFLVPASQQGKITECPLCNGWVDVPEIGRLPNGFEADYPPTEPTAREQAQQWEESLRQLVENARQIEQSQRALDHRDRQDDRYDRLLDHMTAVVNRWDALAERIEYIVNQSSHDIKNKEDIGRKP